MLDETGEAPLHEGLAQVGVAIVCVAVGAGVGGVKGDPLHTCGFVYDPQLVEGVQVSILVDDARPLQVLSLGIAGEEVPQVLVREAVVIGFLLVVP